MTTRIGGGSSKISKTRRAAQKPVRQAQVKVETRLPPIAPPLPRERRPAPPIAEMRSVFADPDQRPRPMPPLLSEILPIKE